MHLEEITCPQVTIRLEMVLKVLHVEESFEASTWFAGRGQPVFLAHLCFRFVNWFNAPVGLQGEEEARLRRFRVQGSVLGACLEICDKHGFMTL